MNQNNTDHIADDFIKKLMKQIPDEKAPAGFTDRVMASIPASEAPVEALKKEPPTRWQWLLLAAAFAGVGYAIFFLNLSEQISGIETYPGDYLINYLNMFSSIVKMFTQGFAGIEITTRPLIIAAAVAVLFFADRYLKRVLNHKTVVA
jgi:hypothetical protein